MDMENMIADFMFTSQIIFILFCHSFSRDLHALKFILFFFVFSLLVSLCFLSFGSEFMKVFCDDAVVVGLLLCHHFSFFMLAHNIQVKNTKKCETFTHTLTGFQINLCILHSFRCAKIENSLCFYFLFCITDSLNTRTYTIIAQKLTSKWNSICFVMILEFDAIVFVVLLLLNCAVEDTHTKREKNERISLQFLFVLLFYFILSDSAIKQASILLN